MEKITINGKPLDLTLENEKTVGEILSGIDEWLEGSGLYLSGLELDGKIYGALSVEEAFNIPLDRIKTVDLKTSGWADLFLEALIGLKNDLEFLKNAPETERKNYLSVWERCPAGGFLEKNASDIHSAWVEILGSSAPAAGLLPLVEERIREICDPSREIAGILPACREIASRLEDLPLDMQTGKDARAVETIILFSSMSEKMFRLLSLLKYYGADTGGLKGFIEDFGSAVKELLSAYENRDSVLVGDLSEYELAPRLLQFSENLNEYSLSLKEGQHGI
jgi:hypothetical protein